MILYPEKVQTTCSYVLARSSAAPGGYDVLSPPARGNPATRAIRRKRMKTPLYGFWVNQNPRIIPCTIVFSKKNFLYTNQPYRNFTIMTRHLTSSTTFDLSSKAELSHGLYPMGGLQKYRSRCRQLWWC